MKRLLRFYPLLLAAFPILFLYSKNMDEVSMGELLLPVIVSVGGALALLLLLGFFTKNHAKTALIVSLFLVLFFSYGRVSDVVFNQLASLEVFDNAPVGGVTHLLLWVLWALVFAAGTVLILRVRRDLSIATKFLGVVVATLILISAANIGIYQARTAGTATGMGAGNSTGELMPPSGLPDIYYIILDAYTRNDVLEEEWGYDNGDFADFLRSRGFYIASQSQSNYHRSILSLASSLNMQYLDPSMNPTDVSMEEEAALLEALQNNEVSQLLKSVGYRYIYVSSGWFENGMGECAEPHTPKYKMGMRNFGMRLVRTTALAPFVSHFISAELRDRVLYSFDKLANLPHYGEPVFVFAHIACPHAPYIFDSEGNPISEEEGTYLGQLTFVNKKVEAVIDEILARPGPSPIIVIQGDHGNPGVDILNAYHLPGGDGEMLYDSITPVNTFRAMFNLYFGASYELLEDISYWKEVK